MKNSSKYFFCKSILILLCGITIQSVAGQVSVTEEVMTIPTYKNEAPNPMPRFFEWRGHQGVQRREYPYPVDDNLTFNKQDIDWPFIHVENEFIDLGIMPILGGRVYYAIDKTNNYNWFYHNHVVKPSLIGMIGNWVSGSLAWGFPHHHGPHTVKPMDYKIIENTDGSKTIWIANTDRLLRLNVLIGYTVYPNSSLLEMTIHPMNNTPISNSFLFWANPAVHVDSAYQVIFPPSVQYVTYHAKRDMTTWPVADGWYNNYDFSGLDVSWWKNTRIPSSFFSWDPREGYFGGYDHAKKAGTVWVGNRYICPGMKYWADGNNARGRQINAGLTDEDGQYIELMVGMYTDNQPDYSWIQPYENKSAKMIWFPMRELAGIKYANRNGALNLQVAESKMVQLRINTTSPHDKAEVILRSGEKVLLQETINIGPAQPYVNDYIPLPDGILEDDLDVVLLDMSGGSLLSYRPAEHHPPDYPKPEPLKPLASPEEIQTVDELYLAGLRLNQFYNPSIDPMPYYEEALKRDPGNCRVNTQLGIISIKNFDWEDAEKYLRVAVDRATSNYTRPKDCESLYYLALVLRLQGKKEEAYDYFYKASWDYAWHTASYYQLAEMDCERGDFHTALDHLDRSLTTSDQNLRSINLKTIVLRKLNDLEAAEKMSIKSLDMATINHQALNELYYINKSAGKKIQANDNLNELTTIMRDEVQSYLELATNYMNCSFFPEAIDILERMEGKGDDFPMIYYYLGYCWSRTGEQNKAIEYYQIASKKPHTYCFPFRVESIGVLKDAMRLNPKDARAHYYLGNLLYEKQPEKAIAVWEKSRELDDSFYIVHRNLALAYQEIQKDNAKALVSIEKAVSCNSTDPRLLFEVDEIYELNKISIQKKYELLKQNEEIAKKRSETLLRLVTRATEYGKYDEAIMIMTNNKIIESEGARAMQNTYLNAYTLRGLEFLEMGKYDQGLNDLETALAYPIGIYGRPRIAQLNYLVGTAYEKLGNPEKAKIFFENTVEVNIESGDSDREYIFYRGLALQKLGKTNEARKLFQNMLDNARNNIEGNVFFTQFEGAQSQDFRKATDHYLAGLAYEGLGKTAKAREEFSAALEFNPSHVWSRIHLTSFEPDK